MRIIRKSGFREWAQDKGTETEHPDGRITVTFDEPGEVEIGWGPNDRQEHPMQPGDTIEFAPNDDPKKDRIKIVKA